MDGVSWKSAGRIASVLERAAFATAAIAYLLPFFQPRVPLLGPVLGLEVFFATFRALAVAPWPWGFLYFVAYGLPLMAALAGFFYRRSGNWRPALARLVLAVVGLVGLAVAYMGTSVGPWSVFGFGVYAAEAGFVVAALAAMFRLVTASNLGAADEPLEDEPAPSAAQRLVRRSRGDW